MKLKLSLLAVIVGLLYLIIEATTELPVLVPVPTLIWTPALPIRTVPWLPDVVADVESHLPVGHPYKDNDLITYVHESTHGINSLLRNLYRCPAFYCLNNKCVLMKEPDTTLSSVADAVPRSLRGIVYHLYLIQAQRWWNDQPTYILSEFSAYANGADARSQLGLKTHGETQFAVEFIVYSSCLPLASKSTDPQMREFLRWQIERVLKLSGPSAYLDKLRTTSDANDLRVFMKKYYGPGWTKQNLNF